MGKKAKAAQRQDEAQPEGEAVLEGVAEHKPIAHADGASATSKKKPQIRQEDEKAKKKRKAKKAKKHEQPAAADEAARSLAEAASGAAAGADDAPEADRQVVVANASSWRRRFVPSWRRILLVVGVLVIVGVAVLLLGANGDDNDANAQSAIAVARTATVERTTLSATIDASGAIAGARSVSLTFGASGTVRSVLVDVGDVVTAGQTLAELDTTDLLYQVQTAEQSLAVQQSNYDRLVAGATESELQQARLSLETAQAQLTSALANAETQQRQMTITCAELEDAQEALETAQKAYDDYLATGYALDATFIPDPKAAASLALSNAQSAYDVSLSQCENARANAADSSNVTNAQANVDKAQANLDALLQGPDETEILQAEAQLEQARIQLEQARNNLQNATLIAPFDGVVTEVGVTEGQNASASTAAVTLVDASQLHLDVMVDELDIGKVAVGQPATITVDAIGDTSFEGTVTRIDPVGTENQGIVTYGVRVSVTPDENTPILLGMTADVELIVAVSEDTLTVPTEAIQQMPNGTAMVFVQDDAGQITPVVVVAGESAGGRTAVTGDLQEGQTVVIPALQTDSEATGNTGNAGGGFFSFPGGGAMGGGEPPMGDFAGGQPPMGNRGGQ
ncbi:MAG: hypothetical protein Kow00120_01850 [Anaerolineae bacterium]